MDSPCLDCLCLMKEGRCLPEPRMMRGYVPDHGSARLPWNSWYSAAELPSWDFTEFSNTFDNYKWVLGILSSGLQNWGKFIANVLIGNFRLNVDFCLLVSEYCSLPSPGHEVRGNVQMHMSTHRKEKRYRLLSLHRKLNSERLLNFSKLCDWDAFAMRFYYIKIRQAWIMLSKN